MKRTDMMAIRDILRRCHGFGLQRLQAWLRQGVWRVSSFMNVVRRRGIAVGELLQLVFWRVVAFGPTVTLRDAREL